MKRILLIIIVTAAIIAIITGCDVGGTTPVADPVWRQVGADFASGVSAVSKICFYNATPCIAAYLSSGIHVYSYNAAEWAEMNSGAVITGCYPSLAASGGTLYLSCRHAKDECYRATVLACTSIGGSWQEYPSPGGTQFTANDVACNSLYASSDTLYLGYCENTGASGWRAAVMKSQNGSAWGALGASAVFTTSSVSTTELDMTGSGSTLYFFYLSSSVYPTVCKYLGNWSALGMDSVIQDGWAGSPSIGLDPAGIPYAAFYDRDTKCVKVKKYDSACNTWNNVGPTDNISDGSAVTTDTYFSVRLFMDSGTPYVAYQDAATKTIAVKKFSGGVWSTVGGVGIACSDMIKYVSVCVRSGVPYLAFAIQSAAPVIQVWKCDL